MNLTYKYDYEAIFQYIVDYKKKHDGNSPSVRELMKAFNINSSSHIRSILTTLEKRGKLRVEWGVSRHIYINGGKWSIE